MQNLDSEPLLAQDKSPLIRTEQAQQTRWTTVSRQSRKYAFLPHHLLEWMYDHVPSSPIPKDAVFHKLQFDARDKYLIFDFHSRQAPEVKAIRISFQELRDMMKSILKDKLPADAVMTGFYRSDLFAYVLIEMSSHKFPQVDEGCQPFIQVRYEGRQLIISDQSKNENRITQERV